MREPERLLASGATDFERKLLEAVKDERPSAELQQRMQRALGLPGAAAAPVPSPTAAPVLAPASGAAGKGLSGVALKVILGSIIAGGLAYSAVSLTTSEAEPSVRAPAAKPQAGTVAAPRRAVAATAAAELSGAESSEAESSEAESSEALPSSAPEPAKADGRLDDARQAPADSDSLRLEIELLDAVRAASLLGESRRAEETLERYDARFPRGALQREADMLRRGGVKPAGATPSALPRGAHPEAASGR